MFLEVSLFSLAHSLKNRQANSKNIYQGDLVKKLLSFFLALGLLASTQVGMANEDVSQKMLDEQIRQAWTDLGPYRKPSGRSYRFFDKAQRVRDLYAQANRTLSKSEEMALEIQDIETYHFVQNVIMRERENMSNINWVNSEIQRLEINLPAYERADAYRASFIRERLSDLHKQKALLENGY